MKRPLDLWIAEQVEAIAIAIAMALVLKFFVIEAYQIPSGSMQPTILGDPGTGIRDRILADKLCTMLRAPRRWEVMIFRFPHDERRLYVKRIVGLPGETLQIRGGDLWIDGAIARKPDHVNDSVLKDVFPPGADGGVDIGRAFSAGPGIRVAGERASFAPEAEGELRLRHTVRADYLHGYDPAWGIAPSSGGDEAVADLRLACRVTPAAGARAVRLRLASDEGEFVFHLPVGEADAATPLLAFQPEGAGPLVALEPASARRLVPGRGASIVVQDVDRQQVLFVDGEEWLRRADDRAPPRPEQPRRALAALALPGGGDVERLRIQRDIFYLPRVADPTWHIPPDSYFALGDNTQGSLDSRNWERHTYVLADREITGFWFPAPAFGRVPPDHNPRVAPDGTITFADEHGDEFTFPAAAVLGENREPGPFIHRRYLLGKAMAVFWPVVNPFRWKLIR